MSNETKSEPQIACVGCGKSPVPFGFPPMCDQCKDAFLQAINVPEIE